MTPDIKWIQENFKRFNSDYFNSELPPPQFKLSRARTRLGAMTYKRKRHFLKWECYDYAILLSTYYEQTERQLQNILLHEMIHYAISYKDIRDTSAHGAVFHKMMNELNKKYGWEITVSTSVKGMQSSKPVSTKKTYLLLALHQNDGKRLLTVTSPQMAKMLQRQLKSVPRLQSATWYSSKNPIFYNWPKVRSLRFRKVTENEWQELLPTMTVTDLTEI